MQKTSALVLLLALLPWLAGCSSPRGSATAGAPVRSLLEQRQHQVVIQQWDQSCGAAALATLMNFQHGLALPEKTIAESMLRRTHPLTVRIKGGFSLLDLKRFVEGLGYQGKAYRQLQFAHLFTFIPAIVPVNLGDYNHFVIVRGIVGDRVLLADPAFGNRLVSRPAFERGWLGNIAFIVKRNDALPAPNRLGVEAMDFVRVQPAAIRQALY